MFTRAEIEESFEEDTEAPWRAGRLLDWAARRRAYEWQRHRAREAEIDAQLHIRHKEHTAKLNRLPSMQPLPIEEARCSRCGKMGRLVICTSNKGRQFYMVMHRGRDYGRCRAGKPEGPEGPTEKEST